MSLRMNLYGWSFAEFKGVLGSNDRALLEQAETVLRGNFKDEKVLHRAIGWLHTLIERGYPFNTEQTAEPQDEAGLLTVKMEAESHVFVLNAIRLAIAKPGFLDLAAESSHWNHSAISMLSDEMQNSGFDDTKICGMPMLTAIYKLGAGTPLFGARFQTTWSFYSLLENEILTKIIPTLEAAAVFERMLPDNFPEHLRAELPTKLSDSAKSFAGDLANWFGQIQRAGQDAFVLWW